MSHEVRKFSNVGNSVTRKIGLLRNFILNNCKIGTMLVIMQEGFVHYDTCTPCSEGKHFLLLRDKILTIYPFMDT